MVEQLLLGERLHDSFDEVLLELEGGVGRAEPVLDRALLFLVGRFLRLAQLVPLLLDSELDVVGKQLVLLADAHGAGPFFAGCLESPLLLLDVDCSDQVVLPKYAKPRLLLHFLGLDSSDLIDDARRGAEQVGVFENILAHWVLSEPLEFRLAVALLVLAERYDPVLTAPLQLALLLGVDAVKLGRAHRTDMLTLCEQLGHV